LQNESGKAVTVLVIDDEPEMLQLLERILTTEGFQVKLASDGVYGISLLREDITAAVPVPKISRSSPSLYAWATSSTEIFLSLILNIMTKFEDIDLEFDESNRIAIIYFNRTKQFNAFNIPLVNELITAFNKISSNDRIRCLVLTGRGKAFSAGGDVVEFKNAEKPDEFMASLVERLHQGIRDLKNMNIPSVAAINGACFGAGLGYAIACDFRISSELATFGCAFTKIGLSPDSSSTFHLPRLVGLGLANEMLFLNRVLNAEEALQFNLVNKLINSGNFLEEVKFLIISNLDDWKVLENI